MNKDSVVITFRINKDLKIALDKECAIKKVSLNHILNKTIEKHVKWDRFAEEIGLIFVSKSIFRNILSKMDEKDIKLLATTICRGTLKDATIYMKGTLNYQNFLEMLDAWISNSHIPFRHLNENGIDKYIIQHELGIKYSIYLSTAVNTLLSEIEYVLKNIDLADQTLNFEVIKL